MSLVLAAHALGYAATWITEWYAYDRRVLAALGLARMRRSPVLCISGGRRSRRPTGPARRSPRS